MIHWYIYDCVYDVVVGVKADCLKKDLGLEVGCPAWGSF